MLQIKFVKPFIVLQKFEKRGNNCKIVVNSGFVLFFIIINFFTCKLATYSTYLCDQNQIDNVR